MAGIRDLTLGRIKLPTLMDDVKESIGDKFDVVGSSVVPGEPQARPFTFTIPIHGDPGDGAALYTMGNRMRRQLRSLIDSPTAGRQPIYMQFNPDSELNGWLLIGGADLSYADGGPTMSEFQLTLTDCYKVASRRTHYQAVRITNKDLRTGLYPRDILKTVTSTDFATAARGIDVIGPRAGSKFFTDGFVPLSTSTARQASGNAELMAASTLNIGGLTAYGDGQIIGWDNVVTADALLNLDDVVILDRRGLTAPTLTAAGDLAMQDTYGWEEVYGPNHPLTDNDLPVIANGRSRVRWDTTNFSLIIEAWMAASGKYDEVARVSLFRDVAGGTMTPTDLGSPVPRVINWTPYTATIKFSLFVVASPAERADVYVTLRHDWYGPKIEMYRHSGAGSRTTMLVAPNSTSALTYGRNSTTTTVTSGAPATNFTAETEPGWYLSSSTEQIIGAVTQKATTATGRSGTVTTGYGDTRAAMEFSSAAADSLGNSYLCLYVAGAATAARATTTASSMFLAAGRWALDDLVQSPELIER